MKPTLNRWLHVLLTIPVLAYALVYCVVAASVEWLNKGAKTTPRNGGGMSPVVGWIVGLSAAAIMGTLGFGGITENRKEINGLKSTDTSILERTAAVEITGERNRDDILEIKSDVKALLRAFNVDSPSNNVGE